MMARRSLRLSGWGQILVLALLGLALIFAAATPAVAHKDHQKKQAESARLAKEAAPPSAKTAAGAAPAMTHAPGGEMMDVPPPLRPRQQGQQLARADASTGSLSWAAR